MNRSKAYGLCLSYAGMMTLSIGINLLPVFLTTLQVDLGGVRGLTNEQLGRLGGILCAGLVTAILMTGPLADRLGFKPFAIIGNALIALGLLLFGLAPTYGTACLAAFIIGLGAGVLDMVLSPIVCALQPDRRTAAMNWLHSFYCTGAVLTILIGSIALRLGITWRTLSLWLMIAPTLLALAFLPMRFPTLVTEDTTRTRLRDLIRHRFFLITLGAIFMGGAMEIGLTQWLPAYAETTLGYSKWISGMSLLFFSLSMALGRIAAGLAGHRLNPFSLILYACGSSAFLMIIGCFAPWPAVALTACMAVGFTGSCLWPSTLGLTANHFPRGGASMFGMLAAFGNFGCVFMPWAVGVAADWSTMRLGLATAAFCPLIMLLLTLKLRKISPNPPPSSLSLS
jgi:fucose permease